MFSNWFGISMWFKYFTWGLIVSFLQLSFSHFTSNSQSKWPILQTMASSLICAKCFPVMISLHPVAVTKIWAFSITSSIVATSNPVEFKSFFHLIKRMEFKSKAKWSVFNPVNHGIMSCWKDFCYSSSAPGILIAWHQDIHHKTAYNKQYTILIVAEAWLL